MMGRLRTLGLVVATSLTGFGFATCGTSNGTGDVAHGGSGVVSAVSRAVLPAPAFAKTHGVGDVSIADVAERTVGSVVNIAPPFLTRY